LQPEGRVVQWPSLNITAPGSYQVDKYRSAVCDFWDKLGFYFDFSLPTQAPDETTTSGFASVYTYFSILCFITALILLVLFKFE